MRAIAIGDGFAHVSDTGPRDAPALVFSNSLGTDFRIWDRLLPLLPAGLRIIRYDTRGHGLSSCPPGQWRMEYLVDDLARILDALGVREAALCGLSVGGMIAQGLAAARLDLVRGLILCDTAARIGTKQMWDERIAAVEAGGIAALEESILARWFSKRFREERKGELALWRAMLTRTPLAGYAGVSAAIRDADLRAQTATLRLPTLAVAGDEDGSTPPDLVAETAALIPGSRFEVIRGAGHLPCIEQPEALGGHVARFLREIGHG